MKKQVKIILVLLAFTSCRNNAETKETIFLAEMQTPMGWNHLKIYKDHSFQLEQRQLLKSTFYEGKVEIQGDTLKFDYSEAVPDFGNTGVIDGIFLTYTNGTYRELLEISLNTIFE